ncbi:hypothetical protein H1_123 [Efunavirus H1]|uniref:Uncharacterized protein n=1 Tax=Enterococcus phage H1 TaxID=2982918 RepID=A0AAE9T7A7_9CAUD|nr:hypothetical protein H1_123 [Enterococcus phage H1]
MREYLDFIMYKINHSIGPILIGGIAFVALIALTFPQIASITIFGYALVFLVGLIISILGVALANTIYFLVVKQEEEKEKRRGK